MYVGHLWPSFKLKQFVRLGRDWLTARRGWSFIQLRRSVHVNTFKFILNYRLFFGEAVFNVGLPNFISGLFHVSFDSGIVTITKCRFMQWKKENK